MADQFFDSLLSSMLSEAGLVAVMLLIAVIYQTKQLVSERKENKKLNAQILTLATGQVSAMNELNSVLKSVMALLPSRGRD